jgi:alanine transaminase
MLQANHHNIISSHSDRKQPFDRQRAPNKTNPENTASHNSTISMQFKLLRYAEHLKALVPNLVSDIRTFATRPKVTMTTQAEIQRAHWNSYVATGRGSASLFGSIDVDADGWIDPSDVRVFVDSIERSMSARALEKLDARAEDHQLDLQEFQRWLIDATHEAGYDNMQTHYESLPSVGERRNETKSAYAWNQSTMSQSLRRMQYAVRGEVVIKADKMASEGREIIYTNIGNPHAVGQTPITFYRQVLALCDLPAAYGVDHPDAHLLFPADVLQRAREMREIVGPAGTGAYTNSQGLAGIRQHVADYISERDGHPAYKGSIFLTNGASSGIEMVLNALISSDHDGIMIPIPQYPIYSALIARLGGRQIGYELDEEMGWAVKEEELYRQLYQARWDGLTIKGLALINPGNPTGQVLNRKNLEVICKFCADNGIVLLADEVYQRNVYTDDKTFISAKKVAVESKDCEHLELVSFHSTSKGLIGECGRRGGYMELYNIDPYVQSQMYKLASSGLCSGVAGQIMTSLMVKGPAKDGESFQKFQDEEQNIFESLKRRAKAIVDGLNKIEGINCKPAEGAMYAFPSIKIPAKAFEAAEEKGQSPDTLYALSLLDETGICVVPASGFGQKKGRVGFRTTFLPPEETLTKAIEEFGRHHKLFCDKYA